MTVEEPPDGGGNAPPAPPPPGRPRRETVPASRRRLDGVVFNISRYRPGSAMEDQLAALAYGAVVGWPQRPVTPELVASRLRPCHTACTTLLAVARDTCGDVAGAAAVAEPADVGTDRRLLGPSCGPTCAPTAWQVVASWVTSQGPLDEGGQALLFKTLEETGLVAGAVVEAVAHGRCGWRCR